MSKNLLQNELGIFATWGGEANNRIATFRLKGPEGALSKGYVSFLFSLRGQGRTVPLQSAGQHKGVA
ncbi:unnamed protein product [marine sediment metagenome]|uniref:Uncharacterized protein n=1 Tax=marine sediment metagenome TaxID=412755 RepID=X0RI12_9ZZZZ